MVCHPFKTLSDVGIVPVVAIDEAEKAPFLAEALLEGGLPVAEITFRTPQAVKAIEAIAKTHPDLCLGAGTVCTVEQVDQAHEAGATFALSPGIDSEVVAHAQAKDLPFAPGVMTPSDLQIALKLRCPLVKFFPAEAAGGISLLKSMAAPYLHTQIAFNPTGGISPETMASWIAIPCVWAVGGSWIATRDDIANARWSEITRKAREAVTRVREARAN